MINIVSKKNKKPGTTGSVSLTGGYGRGEKNTASINLAHNTNGVNVYGSYIYSHDRTYSNMFITSDQNMPFMGGEVSVISRDTTRLVRNNHDASLGFDMKLNAKANMGGNITYNGSHTSSATFTDADYNVLPDSLLHFTGKNRGLNRWNNTLGSLYLEKLVREGEKININLDYLYFHNNARADVQSSFTDKHDIQAGTDNVLFSPGQKGAANTRIQVAVVKMDHSKQLSERIKWETGVKAAYTQSSSRSAIQSLVNGTWISSNQTSNNIVMKEGVGAAYISFNMQINRSTNIVAGARYEYAYTNMADRETGDNTVNRAFGALFPSIFFSRKLHEKSELQLSYTKRISRPSYNDLASYVAYSDPTALYTGNPFLKPTITHNVKLGYNYQRYSFSLLFSSDEHAISRYQLTESPGRDILYISPQNLAWQHNITFQASLPWKITNWWELNIGWAGGLRQYKVEYTAAPFTKSYFGYSMNLNQVFTFPGNYALELSGRYNNTSYDGTRRMDGYGIINLGIKKELKNNGGSLQLAVADLLGDERYNISYGKLTKEAFLIKSHVRLSTESTRFPIIKLTYSRSLGTGTIKSQRKPGSEAQDEKERVRKD